MRVRGYPDNLVNKVLAEVKFTDRKSVLQQKTAKVQSGLMPFVTQYNLSLPNLKNIAMVTLPTFSLEKLDLLTVSLRKLNFSSGTDFFLTWGKFYRLELGYVMRTIEFPLTATPKQEQGQIQIPR